jgi:hypothetical protein
MIIELFGPPEFGKATLLTRWPEMLAAADEA